MTRATVWVIISVMTLGIGTDMYGAENSSRLYAGTAKVDITPDQAFVPATGGCAFRVLDSAIGTDRKTPPAKILDRIFARVIVLKNEEASIAIVSLDVVIFSSKKVVDEAKKKWHVDHVILNSSHAHSSMVPPGLCPIKKGWEAWGSAQKEPALLLDWPRFSEDPWYAATEAKIVAAIGEAMKNLFPAQIVSGAGQFQSDYMAHNRRHVNPDGSVTMMWANPSRAKTKPIDPTVGFIRIDDDSGKPRAFVVHYACHPAAMMNAGVLSRDFPGATVDYIEKELGDTCMAMFLQGAAGDLDTYDMNLRTKKDFDTMRKCGISLGKGALKVAKSISRGGQKEVSIKAKENIVKVQCRHTNKTATAGIMTVVINNDLALVTISGEPFIQHQLDLRKKSPVSNTFLLGYSYCGSGTPWLHYMPTAKAAREGGYGASGQTFIAPDAAEKMVDEAVTAIKKLVAK